MSHQTDTLRAFGEEIRLRILRLVSAQELSVTEVVDILQIPQPRVSRHLAVLRRSDLVRDRRDGNRVYYRMDASPPHPFAGAVWEAVCSDWSGGEFFPEDTERLEEVLARRKDRSRAYFDAVASEWDRIKRNYIQDMLPFLVVAKLIERGQVAADIGTGTGDVLLSVAETAGKVIGVDSSEKMLAECRRRVESMGLKNVELRTGDAEDLPLADAECDTVLSSMLLHHLADPQRGIREMARVLRDGGKCVIIDLVKHANDWTREVMADIWLGFTEEQIRSSLREGGFVDVAYSTSAIRSPLGPEAPGKLSVFVVAATKGAQG